MSQALVQTSAIMVGASAVGLLLRAEREQCRSQRLGHAGQPRDVETRMLPLLNPARSDADDKASQDLRAVRELGKRG